MYSILLENQTTINRAQGISKHIAQTTKHEKYQEVPKQQNHSDVEMTIIKSKNDDILLTTLKKHTLSTSQDLLTEYTNSCSLQKLTFDDNDRIPPSF